MADKPFSSKQIVVCLPTYNEAQNLIRIAGAILEALPRASILIVDDNSPDGTGKLADKLATENRSISVLHRPSKAGLGRAYLNGFHTILDNSNADLIVQMDADLSHPPEKLPGMIHSTADADLVIGSRYVAGGSTKNWGVLRKWVSRFGSFYARLWLGINIRDFTGGFKIWRRELLEKVLSNPISSEGYIFQVETTYIASRLGALITEFPIVFAERETGKSKMTLQIVFEAFWQLPLIRFKTYRAARKRKQM